MSTLLYEWNDAWSVGNKKLDNQHKTLLKLFNDLHELAIEIADFGADWLINHMKSVDKKYCQFILKGKCPK